MNLLSFNKTNPNLILIPFKENKCTNSETQTCEEGRKKKGKKKKRRREKRKGLPRCEEGRKKKERNKNLNNEERKKKRKEEYVGVGGKVEM